MPATPSSILLVHCPDRPGLVHGITGFLLDRGANIMDLEQHVDADENRFFMRISCSWTRRAPSAEDFERQFNPLATELQLQWCLADAERPLRMAVLVTSEAHCLQDILGRVESGEWQACIPLVASNRPQLRSIAERHGIPFHHLEIGPEGRPAQEDALERLLLAHDIDIIILARYMQILSPGFTSRWPERIINIHHSFLPAFAGAKPYHAAHARGVKIIGATAHYATADLDEGPIIAQDVLHVSHRQSPRDLALLGRDVEKIVLSRAIQARLQHRILVWNRRTVVFE